ncbi:MAG: peptidylprolyl isomerase [Bacteroidales bacterium]|nr:peptidylprolyl isomerase [Bacteroidales bacterium]MCR4857786.1 peptidylprolyl isomerase [Bacteroidales bacterium]
MKNINFFIILLSITALSSCSSQKKIESEQKETAKSATTETKNDKMTQILIKTSMGDITIALYNETPLHRDNFIKLVKESYYDGVLFHRIIKGFMIQTGDPDSKTAKPGQRLGMGGPAERIPAEFVPTLFHKRGAVAAARDNNPAKASSGSQFYIVDGDIFPQDKLDMIAARTGKTFSPEQVRAYTTIGGAPFLDGDYTVFGEVVSGMEVVDKIAAQEKDGNDRPLQDIKIISAKIIE